MKTLIKKLNLDIILKDIDKYTFSDLSSKRFNDLTYISDFNKLKEIKKENAEVEKLYTKYNGEFRLRIYDYKNAVHKAKIGGILTEKELHYILFNLTTYKVFSHKFENILKNEVGQYDSLIKYTSNISDFTDLISYLSKIIDEDGYIREDASKDLLSIRLKIKQLKLKSDQVLKRIIKNSYQKLSEAIVTKRNDRDVILVKPEYKNDFGGIVHDESASGNTFYVEPKENVEINNEISILKRKEKEEILRILKEASEEIASNYESLVISLDNFSEIEFIFSKINFCLAKGFVNPNISHQQILDIRKSYHPLIAKESVVKNDIYLDNIDNSLIITGPNTGGKTVILKTVGLCVLMFHLGLYIPASKESTVGYFTNIFIDIGDEQSIENNLSTFSSHMTNIINILKYIDDKSLVLLDELCSGTDPSEGAVISMAILNKLRDKQTTVLCTTHYPEIKDYCFKSNYYKNSSLEFDFNTLKPTYRFIIGLPGKSNAINISYKLGLAEDIIDEANSYLKDTEKDNALMIDKLASSIRDYDNKIAELNNDLQEIKAIKNTLEKNMNEFYLYKDSLYDKLVFDLNSEIETKKEEMYAIYKNFKDKQEAIKQHDFNEIISSIDNKKIFNQQEHLRKSNSRDINIGDDVIVLKYKQRGTVLDKKSAHYIVKMGSLKLTLPKQDIEYVEKYEADIKSNQIIKKNNITNIALDINVIGKNTQEAIYEIEQYIDKVILSGYDTFTIIHGLGSGILKKNISEYLKHNRFVLSYRSGNSNEGGLGVTIVEMK